ncbi:MAG: OmpA family protein, partial [Myxococcota bacterium]
MRTLSVLFVALLTGCCFGANSDTTTTPEPAPEPEPVAAAEPAPEPEPAEEDPSDVRIEGDHLSLDGKVLFESDSDVILEESKPLLDHVATLVRNHPGEIQHLSIVGHTDASGGAAHNQDLSERRAAAVVRALQERNVPTQLEASGVGETEPV